MSFRPLVTMRVHPREGVAVGNSENALNTSTYSYARHHLGARSTILVPATGSESMRKFLPSISVLPLMDRRPITLD